MKRRAADVAEGDDLRAPDRAGARVAGPRAAEVEAGVEVGADAEAFDDFYRREFVSLLVLARALVGPAHAEDVAQEAMLVAFHRWRAIGAMRSPAAYVRGICLHKAVTVVRRRTLERSLWGRFATPAPNGDDVPGESGALWQAVRALPRRQAQVVALHYALDLPVADVAEVLGCAEGTVKVHLHRARAALAATLRVAGEERW